jgi:hypothetical protein
MSLTKVLFLPFPVRSFVRLFRPSCCFFFSDVRSGGEKNYLEFFFIRPLYLISCMYAAYAVSLPSSPFAAQPVSVAYVSSFLLPVLLRPCLDGRVETRSTQERCFSTLLASRLDVGISVRSESESSLSLSSSTAASLSGVFDFRTSSVSSRSASSSSSSSPVSPLSGDTSEEELLRLLTSRTLSRDPSQTPTRLSLRSTTSFGRSLGTRTRSTPVSSSSSLILALRVSFHADCLSRPLVSEIKNPIKTVKRAAPLALILVSIVYMLYVHLVKIRLQPASPN